MQAVAENLGLDAIVPHRIIMRYLADLRPVALGAPERTDRIFPAVNSTKADTARGI